MQFNVSTKDTNIIKVVGVGGGGSNAVTNMYNKGIVGVDFTICNTDNQALKLSPVPRKIQLGPALTEGRGAGSKPSVGKEACLESGDEIKQIFSDNTKMVFITAGMGGGTGTGAAPIIAKMAQELDILTVGIVTMPFTFEGRRRQTQALEGIEELKKNVDTLIVISNDKLREIHGNLSLTSAFLQADTILTTAAKGIAEIITVPGYINVDFEDVNTVMRGSGVAIMGTATMEGDDRARRAVESALNSPLLEDNEIRGAQHILLNITSGTKEVTMDEIFEITEYIQEEAGHGTDLIWGNCFDEKLGEKISVTLIATGFERKNDRRTKKEETPAAAPRGRIVVSLNDDDRSEKGVDFSHKESANSITFDFENPKPTRSGVYANANPANLRNQKEEPQPVAPKQQQQQPQQQQSPLPDAPKPSSESPIYKRDLSKNLHLRLNNPNVLSELENQPAYMRRNVRLDDVLHSSEESVSRWTLEDDRPTFKRDNSYLHDNVD